MEALSTAHDVNVRLRCKGISMLIEYVVYGFVSVLLLIYLVVAMLRPERF